MNLPLFLARRIYHGKADDSQVSNEQPQNRNVSRPAMRIAVIGVAIGLAVMLITVSVILGFKHTVRDKVAGFGSHIQVENLLSLNTTAPRPVCIDDSMRNVLNSIEPPLIHRLSTAYPPHFRRTWVGAAV